MSLFGYKNGRLKILGMTLFKIKIEPYVVKLFLFGVRVCKIRTRAHRILLEFASNTNIDTRDFDLRIAKLTARCTVPPVEVKPSRVAYLATICYDSGGHTKCLRDLADSLSGRYEQALFFSQLTETERCAPEILKHLRSMMPVSGIDAEPARRFGKQVEELTRQIVEFSPATLLVYTHPNDVFSTAVLSLLRKYTSINILFFNHASHLPNLGMSCANLILECLPSTESVTRNKRHLSNTRIVGLQSLKEGETVLYSAEHMRQLADEVGLPEGALVTVSGGSDFKFFDDNDSSEYFEMIKRLLSREPNLYHVIMTVFKPEQEVVVNRILPPSSDERKRLIVVPYQSEYEQYFQLAHVFIDSFPISSALTQIDLMRNKVASVVKINRKQPLYSFHEYQKPDYPYMFEEVADMEEAIVELLHAPEKRQAAIELNYDFWLKTYESSIVRDRYVDIIEGGRK